MGVERRGEWGWKGGEWGWKGGEWGWKGGVGGEWGEEWEAEGVVETANSNLPDMVFSKLS